LKNQLAAVNPQTEAERLAVELIKFELSAQEGDLAARWSEVTVDATFVGPSALLISAVPKTDLQTVDQLNRYVDRCYQIPKYLAQAVDRLRAGVAHGRTPTRSGIRAAIKQIDIYLSSNLRSDIFVVGPSLGAQAGLDAQARIADVVEKCIRPGLLAYRQALVEEFLPVGRAGKASGLCHLPSGEDVYAAALRRHSGTDFEAAQIHRMGLEAIEQLCDEAVSIGSHLFHATCVEDIFRAVCQRGEFRFHNTEDMVKHCEHALKRAEQALPMILSSPLQSSCHISLMNAPESRTGALAYYQRPQMGSGKDGVLWLNTHKAAGRPKYDYEALTFHESIPGHHVQTAVAESLSGIDDFRRFGYLVPYCEGWALYTERLCDELNLYSSDIDRLGMLSFALWRACRLVVDTGIHALGWGRSKAIEFLRLNTGLTLQNSVNEVDRYIAWPGQATGYYLGYQCIQFIRDRARRQAARSFDLPAFHSRLLEVGPVPLTVLERLLLN
jgi:uncharacterized protein (DUF885 family)